MKSSVKNGRCAGEKKMNLNQLKYFLSVAEHHSFTKAATQHYISQTAITQQIHALEETVGTQLIDRNSRPISLTPAGNVFLGEVKAILERMDTALWRTREASTGLVGTLRVGYTKGYEHSDLSSRLRAFHKEFPNILTTCYRSDTEMLAAGLLNREYDIIFTWDSTNIRQEKRLKYQLVENVPLMVALYDSHPFARRPILSRRDLKGETLLFMSPDSTGESFGDAYYIQLYQRAGYQPNILLRTSDVESVIMMISAEEGICILPTYCMNMTANADNVRFVPLEGEEETEEILAVWREDDPSPALRYFIERL